MALPQASTTFQLRSVGRTALNYLNGRLRKEKQEVVATQLDVLALLAERPEIREIPSWALLLNLAASTLRKSLARLERKGLLVSSRMGKPDRRRKTYQLTDRGREVLASAGRIVENILQPRLQHRLRTTKDGIHTLLRSLNQRLILLRYEESYMRETSYQHAIWAGSTHEEAMRIMRESVRARHGL